MIYILIFMGIIFVFIGSLGMKNNGNFKSEYEYEKEVLASSENRVDDESEIKIKVLTLEKEVEIMKSELQFLKKEYGRLYSEKENANKKSTVKRTVIKEAYRSGCEDFHVKEKLPTGKDYEKIMKTMGTMEKEGDVPDEIARKMEIGKGELILLKKLFRS